MQGSVCLVRGPHDAFARVSAKSNTHSFFGKSIRFVYATLCEYWFLFDAFNPRGTRKQKTIVSTHECRWPILWYTSRCRVEPFFEAWFCRYLGHEVLLHDGSCLSQGAFEGVVGWHTACDTDSFFTWQYFRSLFRSPRSCINQMPSPFLKSEVVHQ